MTEAAMDNDTMVAVTQADRNLFKLIITGMVGPTKHNAIDGGGFDADERMQAIARHRHQSETGAALPSKGRDGFEAEHDNDTFTIRFPGGHAITAWDDGRLIVTKTEPGFAPFAVNIAALAQPVPSHEVDADGRPTDDSDPWFQLGWHKDRLERAEIERDEWKERAMSLRLAQPVEAGEDGLREAMRQQGQREGKAAVCQWLRDRGVMRPPAVLHHAAGILADQFEQSEIPGASK